LKKTEARPSPFTSNTSGGLSPSETSLECFPAKTKEKLKIHTNLHTLKGLGGLKPPPKQVKEEQKPLLALKGLREEVKTGRREAWNPPPANDNMV
jgi:hypothetical protein